MPTSEELLELANRCASKLELDGMLRHVPSFSDAEGQCEDEYEYLLQALHEDELFAPVDGEVLAVNHEAIDDPSVVNSDPFGAGWLMKLKVTPADIDALLDRDAYVALTGGAA